MQFTASGPRGHVFGVVLIITPPRRTETASETNMRSQVPPLTGGHRTQARKRAQEFGLSTIVLTGINAHVRKRAR
jgi:hypothetical protein